MYYTFADSSPLNSGYLTDTGFTMQKRNASTKAWSDDDGLFIKDGYVECTGNTTYCPSTSEVFEYVIDCVLIGALPPTATLPTKICLVFTLFIIIEILTTLV